MRRTNGTQNQFFTFRTIRTTKENNSQLCKKTRPILRLLSNFDFRKQLDSFCPQFVQIEHCLTAQELFICSPLLQRKHLPENFLELSRETNNAAFDLMLLE